MTRRVTCINCPMGCEMDVLLDAAGGIVSVSGNECARGPGYAAAELANPVRVVTTTVRVRNADVGALPVKTSAAVPRDMVEAVAAALRDICVEAPVEMGAVVLHNVCGVGADIVATRGLCRTSPKNRG